MKNLYMIYIIVPSDVFNSRIKYLIDSRYSTFKYKDGFITGLYAWSTNKKLVKKFIESRADVFKVKKKEMSDASYKKYKKNYFDLRLEDRRYFADVSIRDNDVEKVVESDLYMDVISTKFEFIAATYEISENMASFGPASYLSYDYKIFNDLIIEALDVLQYTLLYDTFVPTNPESDEMLEREDVAHYNSGFNLTPYSNIMLDFTSNECVALLYLFSYTFFGVL